MIERLLLCEFYLLWLAVAAIFTAYYGFGDYTMVHLLFAGFMPLAGLWLLYWKNDATYFFVGVLLVYLAWQVRYFKVTNVCSDILSAYRMDAY